MKYYIICTYNIFNFFKFPIDSGICPLMLLPFNNLNSNIIIFKLDIFYNIKKNFF